MISTWQFVGQTNDPLDNDVPMVSYTTNRTHDDILYRLCDYNHLPAYNIIIIVYWGGRESFVPNRDPCNWVQGCIMNLEIAYLHVA